MSAHGVIPAQRTHESRSPGGEPTTAPRPAVGCRAAQGACAAARRVHLGKDLVTIAMGTEEHAPAEKDKRFADPTWRTPPGYRRRGAELHRVDGGADPAGRPVRGRAAPTGGTSSAPASR